MGFPGKKFATGFGVSGFPFYAIFSDIAGKVCR
jgi:hypothetical protein